MTITAVRSQLVTIIQGVTPALQGYGLGASFKHVDTFSGARAGFSRAFCIEAPPPGGFANLGPQNATITKRRFALLAARIRYPTIDDLAYLREAAHRDLEDLTIQLQNPAQWNRPTSSIVAIAIEGGRGERHLEGGVEEGPQVTDVLIQLPVTYRDD